MNAAGEDMKKQGVRSAPACVRRSKRLLMVRVFFSFPVGLTLDLPRGHTKQQARTGSVAVQEGRIPSRRPRYVRPPKPAIMES